MKSKYVAAMSKNSLDRPSFSKRSRNSKLSEVIIADDADRPGALIGFAGPRVIKQTIGADLPEGFQRAEFLLEKGFLDMIVAREDLKQKMSEVLDILYVQA